MTVEAQRERFRTRARAPVPAQEVRREPQCARGGPAWIGMGSVLAATALYWVLVMGSCALIAPGGAVYTRSLLGTESYTRLRGGLAARGLHRAAWPYLALRGPPGHRLQGLSVYLAGLLAACYGLGFLQRVASTISLGLDGAYVAMHAAFILSLALAGGRWHSAPLCTAWTWLFWDPFVGRLAGLCGERASDVGCAALVVIGSIRVGFMDAQADVAGEDLWTHRYRLYRLVGLLRGAADCICNTPHSGTPYPFTGERHWRGSGWAMKLLLQAILMYMDAVQVALAGKIKEPPTLAEVWWESRPGFDHITWWDLMPTFFPYLRK